MSYTALTYSCILGWFLQHTSILRPFLLTIPTTTSYHVRATELIWPITVWSISCHITPVDFISLKGRHTWIHTDFTGKNQKLIVKIPVAIWPMISVCLAMQCVTCVLWSSWKRITQLHLAIATLLKGKNLPCYLEWWLVLYKCLVSFSGHGNALFNKIKYVTRFAKRGLIHAQFHDTLFIAIC